MSALPFGFNSSIDDIRICSDQPPSLTSIAKAQKFRLVFFLVLKPRPTISKIWSNLQHLDMNLYAIWNEAMDQETA